MGTLSTLAASISNLVLAATVITTGMLSDRLGRRKVLLAALLLRAVGDRRQAQYPWRTDRGRIRLQRRFRCDTGRLRDRGRTGGCRRVVAAQALPAHRSTAHHRCPPTGPVGRHCLSG